MRARPIGTKPTMSPTGDKQRRRSGNTVTGTADIYPTTIRIDGGERKETRHRKARLIITSDSLYVATSPDAGMTVGSVKKYPLPKGDRIQRASNAGSWGQFSWQPCSCGNSWGRHTRESLIAAGDAKTA